MKQELDRQQEILISVSDVFRAFKKKRHWILFLGLVFGAFALIDNLFSTPQFQAKGVFKEKTTSQAGFGGQMQALLSNLTSDNSGSAISFMKSQKIMDRVVKKLNLQAVLIENSPKSTWTNLSKNLKGLKAFFIKDDFGSYQAPIFDEMPLKISCESITFDQRFTKTYLIEFISDDKYYLIDSSGEKHPLNISEKVTLEEGSFCLSKQGNAPLKGLSYTLILYPLHDVSSSYISRLDIEKDKKDKNLVNISFKDSSPQLAANFINQLMITYEDFLDEENKKTIEDQINYLNYRKEQVNKGYSLLMEEHSNYLKNKILEFGGFPDTGHELSFLSNQQGTLKNRAFELNRTKALLEADKNHNYVCDEHITANDPVLFELFLKKREMGLKYDSLALDITDDSNIEEMKDVFSKYIKSINEIEIDLEKINTLEIKLSSKDNFDEKIHTILTSTLISQDWKNQLKDHLDKSKELFSSNLYENQSFKSLEALAIYLNNQKKLLLMRLELLKGRLLIQKDFDDNFKGLSLESSEVLLKDFNLELNKSITTSNLYSVAESQIKDSNFEVTSLVNLLQDDYIIKEMVNQSAFIQQKLHDLNNLSSKEAERLKNDLLVKRNFLKDHISYVKEGNLEEGILLRLRILELKKSIMNSLKREIAVINNQLNDYKISRFNAVEQENILIENLLNDLNTKISLLPEKWFEEKKLETAVQAQSEVIAQIAEIVEAQNISGNLKKNESFHLDFATIPTAPKVLHILVYTFVFTLLGSLFGASLVIFDIIYKGVSVSKENLLLLGKKVFGSIDKGNQEDIKAARKVINFIEDNHKTLSFIHPSCQGFVSLVASLLVKKGKKTLILDLTFLDPNELDPKESTSLKNFLEGDTKGLRPHNSSFGYEYLYGGVYSPFAIELIQRKEFKNLFEALKNQYDIILINLPILPTSFESHLLKDLADKTVIALNEEKLNDLSEFLEDNQNHYGFIFST